MLSLLHLIVLLSGLGFMMLGWYLFNDITLLHIVILLIIIWIHCALIGEILTSFLQWLLYISCHLIFFHIAPNLLSTRHLLRRFHPLLLTDAELRLSWLCNLLT